MIPKDNNLYILHIIEAILRIENYSAGGREEFLRSVMVQDAVSKNLEVIGEASNRMSVDFKNSNPQVPWRDIISCRNYIIHNYDGIDPEKIWEIVEIHIPLFKTEICRLMPNWEDYKHNFKI